MDYILISEKKQEGKDTKLIGYRSTSYLKSIK